MRLFEMHPRPWRIEKICNAIDLFDSNDIVIFSIQRENDITDEDIEIAKEIYEIMEKQ